MFDNIQYKTDGEIFLCFRMEFFYAPMFGRWGFLYFHVRFFIEGFDWFVLCKILWDYVVHTDVHRPRTFTNI